MCFACLLVLEFLPTELSFFHMNQPQNCIFLRTLLVIFYIECWSFRSSSFCNHISSNPLENISITTTKQLIDSRVLEMGIWIEWMMRTHSPISLTHSNGWCDVLIQVFFFSSSWAFQVIPCSVTQQKKTHHAEEWIAYGNENCSRNSISLVGRTDGLLSSFSSSTSSKMLFDRRPTTSRIMQC